MSHTTSPPTPPPGTPLTEHIRLLIESAVPGAQVEVHGAGGGHFRIAVVAAAFAGKSLLEKQRLVYGAIAPLMKGEDAPVHAIDQLVTKVPA